MSEETRPCVTATSSGDVEVSDSSKLAPNPVVSVCMITYNHAPYIRESLDSVLMQHMDSPYEICLGEDGSTDGTREICLEYTKRHPDKIRLFLRDRSNPARKKYKAVFMHNRVETSQACRGKYIALLEGDDYWTSPRKLQLQVDLMESDQRLAVSGHYAMCMYEGRPWTADTIPDVPVDGFRLDDILRRDVGNIHTSTWMLRQPAPVDWGAFSDSNFGDYPMLVSSMLHGTGCVLPWVMSVYRVHPGGVFGPLADAARMQQNVVLWELIRHIVPPKSIQAAEVGVGRTHTWLVAEYRKAWQLGKAARSFWEALAAIGKMRACSRSDRARLRILAMEALFLPRLRGLRNRLRRWRSRRAPVWRG